MTNEMSNIALLSNSSLFSLSTQRSVRDETELLVRPAIGGPLNDLRALGLAGACYVEIQAAPAIDKVVHAVADRANEPLIVERCVCGVLRLDDGRASGQRGALHGHH